MNNTNVNPILAAAAEKMMNEPKSMMLKSVLLDNIQPHPLNEIYFSDGMDDETIIELAESIELNGLISPIAVKPIKGQRGKYVLLSGHKRLKAFYYLRDIKKLNRFSAINAGEFVFENEAEEKIFIIHANTEQRQLTVEDLVRLSKEVIKAFEELKQLGSEKVKGIKIREYVAKNLNTNRTYAQHMINAEKLPKHLKQSYEKGEIDLQLIPRIQKLSRRDLSSVEEKVKTNGSWNIQFLTDIEKNKQAGLSARKSKNVKSDDKSLFELWEEYTLKLIKKAEGSDKELLEEILEFGKKRVG